MPSFLASLFLFWSSIALAADNPVACQGASCKVVVETRDGSNAKVTAGQASGTGAWTLGPSAGGVVHQINGGWRSPFATYNTGASNIGHGTLGSVPEVFLRITSSAAWALICIPAGSDGQVLTVLNVNPNNMQVNHNDGSCTTGDRIITSTGASISTTNEGYGQLVYSTTDTAWYLLTLSQ